MMGMNNLGMTNTSQQSPQPQSQQQQQQEPPELRYRVQLEQLNDMGFTDKQANLRALEVTGGSVQLAIERLLSNL